VGKAAPQNAALLNETHAPATMTLLPETDTISATMTLLQNEGSALIEGFLSS